MEGETGATSIDLSLVPILALTQPRNGVLNNARDDTLVIDVKINRISK